MISGQLRLESYRNRGELDSWQKTGWYERPSLSRPGLIMRLKWTNIDDGLQYDLIPKLSNIRVPVIMIVGDQDDSTPFKTQKVLYDQLKCQKEIHVVKNAPHTFRNEEHLNELKEILSQWIINLKP